MALGRFIQPDTIVPEPGNASARSAQAASARSAQAASARSAQAASARSAQALNRYAYVLNNPLRYNDPSGHWIGDPYDPAGIETKEEELTFWKMHYLLLGKTAIVQVNLSSMKKVNQYAVEITGNPQLGWNTCGLIAAADAMNSGDDLLAHITALYEATRDPNNPSRHLYDPAHGIQPTPYVQALKRVYGADRVTAYEGWDLGDLFSALQNGKIVIVDIRVGTFKNPAGETPTVEAPNTAHFARVVGINWGQSVIYIQNTLTGGAYWTIPLNNFLDVWEYPETKVSNPAPDAEEVTRWAVVLTP